MRITLNLASKPFIEFRPLYARLRWWMAILLLAWVPLWLLLKTEQRKAALANARLQGVEAKIRQLQNQQNSYQAMMRQPQNEAVLIQAAFLNQLFARKAFSWTAVMMDLETVLPAGVQVMNIDPVTDKAGNVTIRLRVNGQRDRAVELVRNLEHSHRFLEPRLASESADTSANQSNLQPASATTNVNFDILADYNPLQPHEAKAAESKNAENKSGESKGAPESSDAASGVKSPAGPAATHPRHTPRVQASPRPHPAAKGAQ
jgi:type IV pilus assembly protein PilN